MAKADPRLQELDASIRNHVADMIQAARTKYDCVVGINQTKRTPEQAQTFHVLHMYLYNYFPHRLPKHHVTGGRTIDWEYLKDPKIQWALIDDTKSQFLLTADGNSAMLVTNPDGTKQWHKEPDKAASGRAMAAFLKQHSVSSMAAPGRDGCGEPCLCGGNASKHVSGKAADLNGLQALGHAIRAAEPGKYGSVDAAVDDFLHGFHLWRPLVDKPGKSRELWHVEAIAGHVPKPHHKHRVHPRHHVSHAREKGHYSC